MEAKSIGKFIATLRKANGYTQAQLAEMLGVSNKTISNWEMIFLSDKELMKSIF